MNSMALQARQEEVETEITLAGVVSGQMSDPFAGGDEAVELSDLSRTDAVSEICDCLLDMATVFFGVSGKELRSRRRSTVEITRIRQIIMYVAHTILDMSMREVALAYGRDRTTVLYAVHLIEGMRDDADFDAIVARVEKLAKTALRGRKIRNLR